MLGIKKLLIVFFFVLIQSAFADSEPLFENRYRIVIPARNLIQVECKDASMICVVRSGRFEVMKEEFRTLVYERSYQKEKILIVLNKALGSKNLLVNGIRSRNQEKKESWKTNSLDLYTEGFKDNDKFSFKLKFDNLADYNANASLITHSQGNEAFTIVLTISETAFSRGFGKEDEVELKREIGISKVYGDLVQVPIRTVEKQEFVKILQDVDATTDASVKNNDEVKNFFQDGVKLEDVFDQALEEVSAVKNPAVAHLLKAELSLMEKRLEEEEKAEKELSEMLKSF